MSGSLSAFLIEVAAAARQVAHPEIRAKLLADLVDEGARSHPDRDLRGVLTYGREMVLDMAAKAAAYPQPHRRA